MTGGRIEPSLSFGDAGSSFGKRQLEMSLKFAELGVSWYEEPVLKTDLAGLHLLRNRAPPCMEVSGGEYGYELADFRAFIEADALDVIRTAASAVQGRPAQSRPRR